MSATARNTRKPLSVLSTVKPKLALEPAPKAPSRKNHPHAGVCVGIVTALPDGTWAVSSDGTPVLPATLAVYGGYVPVPGDRVVFARDESHRAYILGVLDAQDDPRRAQRVTDRDGRLLFEHLPHENRSVVYAPAGDLELRSDHGSITLTAAQAVHIQGEHRVDLTSGHTVMLSSVGTEGTVASHVTVDHRGVSLAGKGLEASATRAELSADETRVVAKTLSLAAETVREVIGLVETHATRVVSRVKNAYHEVEELTQTRAGRIRVIAATTFHLMGQRVLLKSEQDIKLKAEKIHLG